jgi:hypothetical protein
VTVVRWVPSSLHATAVRSRNAARALTSPVVAPP